MQLQLWIRLGLKLGLRRLLRTCGQCCWTLGSTSSTARTCPPSSERICYIILYRNCRKLIYLVFCNFTLNFFMQLQLWIRLGLRRLLRTCGQSCWTLGSTSSTARTCPPSSERILDTYILALHTR
jgi:hypothetical protein